MPFFRLVFPPAKFVGQKRKKGKREEEEEEEEGMEKPCIEVHPYTIPNRGPYPFNQPKK